MDGPLACLKQRPIGMPSGLGGNGYEDAGNLMLRNGKLPIKV
jgi:hypothetical protein